MIQKKVVDAIYKRFRKAPASPDELNIPLLFEKLPEEANVQIEGDCLIMGCVESSSPFHSIPVRNIHAIIEFDEAIAIVLHSSIIFVNKNSGDVFVHLKDVGPGFMMRLRSFVTRQAVL